MAAKKKKRGRPRSKPQLIKWDESPTSTLGYAVNMAAFYDPAEGGAYMTIGVGGARRCQTAKLTQEQANAMVRKLQGFVHGIW